MKKLLILAVLIMTIAAVVWVNAPFTLAHTDNVPPPTPTPGLPPDLPRFMPGSTPIKTREEAITTALAFDRLWTARTDALNAEKILVEYYATRQEAADKYDLGVFADPEDALDPTWVVILSGEVQANSMGRVGEMEMVDGVVYLFSATDSNIVAQINGLP